MSDGSSRPFWNFPNTLPCSAGASRPRMSALIRPPAANEKAEGFEEANERRDRHVRKRGSSRERDGGGEEEEEEKEEDEEAEPSSVSRDPAADAGGDEGVEGGERVAAEGGMPNNESIPP